MSRRIDGTPSGDQQDTAAMPALDLPDLTPVKPARRHRRQRHRHVSGQILAAIGAGALGLTMLASAGLMWASRDGEAAREQATPSPTANLVSSVPRLVVPAPPHTRPADRVRPRRRFVPALPVPTSKRPSATHKASASVTPKTTRTATPKPTPTMSATSGTPGASGVTVTSSKERPCPA